MVSESRLVAPGGGVGGLAGSGAGAAALGSGIGVEAKLVIADPDHVGSGQQVSLPASFPIDVRAVDAEVHQQVALRVRPDLGMVTRHVVAGNHDIRARVPADPEWALTHVVFPAVRKTHQPSAGGSSGRLAALGGDQIGKGAGVEELSAAAAGRVHYPELVRADADLVAVQQRSGLRPQANPVDPHFCLGRCGPNGGRARLSGLYQSVARLHPLAFQHHFIVRRRSDSCLTGSYGVSLAADFEMDHRYPAGKKSNRRNVSAGM